MQTAEEQEDQAAKVAMELFSKLIVAKRMDFTVAILMAEDILSAVLGAMCPACREEHWRMLQQHFAGIRERAEELYRSSYPNKPPVCDKMH